MSVERERILVVGTPYLGDAVLAVPVLRNLRRAFPGHAIDFLAEPGAAARLLADCPYVDEVLRWDRPARGAMRRRTASLDACAESLRPRRHARAYLLKRSPSAAFVAYRAGIPHRVGHAALPGVSLLTRAVRWSRDRHYADGLLDLLRADGVAVDDGRAEHWVTPAAHARVDAQLRPLPPDRPRVFVAVRATDGRRQWLLDRWIDVLRRLVRDHRAEIVFCGGPDDAAAVCAITADLGAAAAHAHDLSARVPLADVAALLSRLDLYLGVNSGLMHLAAACGTPTVAVFDAADATRWSPRGTPHAILCGAAPRWRGMRRLVTRHWGWTDVAGWPSGTALRAVTIDAVVAQAAAFLAARPVATPLPTLDLRTGRHRYGAVIRSAGAAETSDETATAGG